MLDNESIALRSLCSALVDGPEQGDQLRPIYRQRSLGIIAVIFQACSQKLSSGRCYFFSKVIESCLQLL